MRKLLVFLLFSTSSWATIRNAATCNLTDVQAQVTASSPGDQVNVPTGTCSWSGGITISGIFLNGGGKSTIGTVITAGVVTMNKNASFPTRFENFRMTSNSDSHVSFQCGGLTLANCISARALVAGNLFIQTNNSGIKIVDIGTNGLLIHHTDFVVSPGTSGDPFSIRTNEQWQNPPTMGNQDTQGPQGGERNIYFEDDTFSGFFETGPDCDVGTRLVVRHSTYTDSSMVCHSSAPNDTGALTDGGQRHTEYYNNTFSRVDINAPLNKWIWMRGGTFVIANNVFDRASSSQFPGKPDIKLTVVCNQAGFTSYPVPHQIGQSVAQTNPASENPPAFPGLIFGNTGAGTGDSNFIAIGSSDTGSGGSFNCPNPANFIQAGRDYYTTNQWGWVAFTYPHPLVSGGGGSSGPIVQFNPQLTLNFGAVIVGVLSTSSFTISNIGASPLTITAMSAGGDYVIQSTTCGTLPATVNASSSCTVTVAFTPTQMGTRTATFSMTDNATGSPHTLNLTGTGQPPTSPATALFSKLEKTQ